MFRSRSARRHSKSPKKMVRPRSAVVRKSSLRIEIERMERHLKSLHPKKRKLSMNQIDQLLSKNSCPPSLRRENSLLKKQLTDLIYHTKISSGSSSEQRKLEKLDIRVHQLRLLHDQIRASKNLLEKENERKSNILRDLILLRQPIFAIKPALKKKITKLENQLDKVLIRLNECQERSEKYNSTLSSLQVEQRQFDHRLNEIEKSLLEKSYDSKELEKLFMKAKTMKERTRQILSDIISEMNGMVSQKEKEIHKKMRFVGEKIALTKKMTGREERRRNVEVFGKEENDSDNLMLRVVMHRLADRMDEKKTP